MFDIASKKWYYNDKINLKEHLSMAYSGKKLGAVIDYIEKYVQTNALSPGSKLPPERELIDKTGVSRVTVRRAMANLQEAGIIYSIHGGGYYLSDKQVSPAIESIPLVISYNHGDSKILDIVHGAQDYLIQHNCRLNLSVSGKSSLNEQEIINQLYNDGIRSVMVFPVSSETNTDFYFNMIQKGMHFVFIDRKPKKIFGYSFVQSDNISGGYIATKHLIERGHRKIAMFGFEELENTSSLYERSLGYLFALREAEIPCPEQYYFISRYRTASPDIEKLFDPKNGFTAVFATTDHAAVDIANHAFKAGLRIPDDISVIGFDNLDITSVFSPTISTIAQPFTRLGECAAELAYGYLTGAYTDNIQKTLPVKLITRESTEKMLL